MYLKINFDMEIWQEKITKAVDRILNMKHGEIVRFYGFVIKCLPTATGNKWMILSSDQSRCQGVLYADVYDNDTQFTNDLIGLIF